jgi:CubicO group peptidase (beta-lactamase class C family)
MKNLKLRLEQLINENVEAKLFPACVLGAITPSGKFTVCGGTFTYEDRRSVGADSVFDVASLTKVIPTSSLALKLIEEGRLGLRDDIKEYLPAYQSNGDKVTVWNLLTHTVYYEFGYRLSSISHRSPEEILRAIYAAPARTSDSELTYTNSSSILLGLIVERIYGRSLDKVGDSEFFGPLGMSRTGFDPLSFATEDEIVPTEVHERRGLVRGQVHDESAFGLKPIKTGTAGLFTTAPDLLKFLDMLINGGEFAGHRYFLAKTITEMGRNQLEGPESTGLGWELDQPRYMGLHSKGTFGKTGITGCLILCNPKLGAGLVILSNHIHPKRPDSFDAINRFRRAVADTVFGPSAA